MSGLRPAPRQEARELLWLELAELDAGASGFAEHAIRRLAEGERLYGSHWAELGLERLVDELLEEAADLGAWGVLALQALEALELHEPNLDGPRGELIATALRAAILWGAFGHRALTIARGHLEDGRGR